MNKKTRTLGIRLTEPDIKRFSDFAEESGIPLAEMFRRLMDAATKCFAENEGWPREIAVVKKSRDGVNVQPAVLMATPGTNFGGRSHSITATTAAEPPKIRHARPVKVLA